MCLFVRARLISVMCTIDLHYIFIATAFVLVSYGSFFVRMERSDGHGGPYNLLQIWYI